MSTQTKKPKTAEDILRFAPWRSPQTARLRANTLCGENIYDINGVADIDYPIELNAFIIVMDDGKKYLVGISEYTN